MTRILFFGTPASAVPSLRVLNEHYQVVSVVTQPDRPKGRSGTPSPPPIKVTAGELDLQVAQPTTRAELAEAVKLTGLVDVGVVVAYGQILRPEVLEVPRMGLVNGHFSLLPRWRGAAPVARAIMAGDTMTGVTIMRLDEGLDTGPILTAQAVDVGADENTGTLTARLADLSARLLTDTIPHYLEGTIAAIDQVEEGATYATKITSEDRRIDLDSLPEVIVDHVRALSPTPGATLGIDGDVHRVLAARVSETVPQRGRWSDEGGVPIFGAADGGVELLSLQPPGRRSQSGADWLRGRRSIGGEVG